MKVRDHLNIKKHRRSELIHFDWGSSIIRDEYSINDIESRPAQTKTDFSKQNALLSIFDFKLEEIPAIIWKHRSKIVQGQF